MLGTVPDTAGYSNEPTRHKPLFWPGGQADGRDGMKYAVCWRMVGSMCICGERVPFEIERPPSEDDIEILNRRR